MAQSLKELETPAGTPSASAPAAPQPKPQPVALEIPVTVNGARTVEGSDKRVPFSENTQTVLVLPHGAVIRTTTPLASGQLVFLTNEKTKKEVVCQVIKSKSTGSSGSYVELQFTEPAPGYWGMQLPGASATPAGPRPVAPVAPKAVAPPAPVAVKPPVVAEPVPAPPAKTIVLPPPAPAAALPSKPIAAPVVPPPEPPVPVQASAPAIPAVVVPAGIIKESPKAPVAEELAAAPPVSSSPEPANAALPNLPTLHNYGKEIEALFAPARPAAATPAAESHTAPASSPSSSEDLKQQTARLQAQLSSMLFAENPSAPVASAVTADVAKVSGDEKATLEAKTPVVAEQKSAAQAPKAPAASLTAEEESVKIPSWLAPISQNAATASTLEGAENASENAVSVNSEESFDALVGDAPRRPQTAVFGGQLLGEAAAPAEEAPATGSKKGIVFGLIAATLVIGGGWYYWQTQSHGSSAGPKHAVSAPAPSAESAESAAPVSSASAPASSKASAPAPAQPVRNAAPAPTPAPQPKNTKSTQKNVEPPSPEEPEKTSLGEVHLASPVVNHGANSQLDADGLQSVTTTNAAPAGADPFGAGNHNVPTAPLPKGGDVTPAQLIKSVPPEYPAIAKSQHISGKVTLDALIDASGNVASLKIVSGPALLHHAALDAVKQWKYKPAILDGEATSSHLAVTVEFRAQ